MRRIMHDPTIEISFPTADGSSFVGAGGSIVGPRRGRVETDLVVQGDLLARVSHAGTERARQSRFGLDAETFLRLHNERLNAQLAARVLDLTRERRQVVRAGLDERRGLERDLHDGVQQELLALGLDIRLALATLSHDSPDEPLLNTALALVHRSVDQVRAISTGVSPPMLETLGLRAAVRTRWSAGVAILSGCRSTWINCHPAGSGTTSNVPRTRCSTTPSHVEQQ